MAEHGTGALEPINSWAASGPTYGSPGAPPIALYGVLAILLGLIYTYLHQLISAQMYQPHLLYAVLGPIHIWNNMLASIYILKFCGPVFLHLCIGVLGLIYICTSIYLHKYINPTYNFCMLCWAQYQVLGPCLFAFVWYWPIVYLQHLVSGPICTVI